MAVGIAHKEKIFCLATEGPSTISGDPKAMVQPGSGVSRIQSLEAIQFHSLTHADIPKSPVIGTTIISK